MFKSERKALATIKGEYVWFGYWRLVFTVSYVTSLNESGDYETMELTKEAAKERFERFMAGYGQTVEWI